MPYAIIQYLIKNSKFSGLVKIQLRLAETENQIIFRQNMFGNSYSTLNILPNGIQYVNSYSILIFFFFLFLSKNQTLSVELENDTKCFYLIWMFAYP